MKIVNLTPHNINLILDNNKILVIESSGVARCNVETRLVNYINDIPVYRNRYTDVVGLPDGDKDTVYVVSRIVAEAVKDKRFDCVIVDNTIRDEKNFIIGCKGFAVIR